MPVPSGLLIPIFKSGAALGRLFGEVINIWFIPVLPGAYAIAVSKIFHVIRTSINIFIYNREQQLLLPV